jgi:hypothetical protein
MPRGKASDEIEFGSDSFLDVVANIVGILIILIVVAGIKAGSAPISAARISQFLQKQTAPSPPPPPVEASPLSRPAPVPIAAEPLVIPPSPALLRKSEALKAELASLATDTQSSSAQINQEASQEKDVDQQIAEVNQKIESESAELGNRQRQLAEAQSRVESLKTGLLQMEVDVKQASQEQPALKTIKHQLTPLSREIQGKEISFRLSGNKVVYLPVEELMERLKPEVAQHRAQLLRDGIHRGEVGPVRGFRMEYVLEVRRLSIIDELRRGSAMTMGLSNWRLEPESDLNAETAEEALKEGSDFLQSLRGADSESTITFWVYPDSFELYRKLQEFAHHENFTVAARPIPYNVPIAGSPHGSRSSGQ